MTWDEYGAACRERGALAMQVFACNSSAVKPGPPPPDVQQEHLAYMKKLEASGDLFLAGPLSDETGTQMGGKGLLVLRAATIVDARKLAEGDPMHREGVRTFTLTAWRLNEGSSMSGVTLSNRSEPL